MITSAVGGQANPSDLRYSRAPRSVKYGQKATDPRGKQQPLAEIRRYAELVREGPGNEQKRVELLREQQARVEHQLTELQGCLRIIIRKVGTYEQHPSDGTAKDLWNVTA